MIANCPNCKPHAYQDKTYGQNKRVMNPTNNSKRCTVCDKEVTVTTTKK